MNLITGEIIQYLNCLGYCKGDEKILDIVSLVADNFIISQFDYSEEVYYKFINKGVELLFDENKILKCIFIYVQDDEDYKHYPYFDNFIIGLTYSSSKNDIIQLLGLPDANKQNFIKYKMHNFFIHFEFKQNTISLVSLFI